MLPPRRRASWLRSCNPGSPPAISWVRTLNPSPFIANSRRPSRRPLSCQTAWLTTRSSTAELERPTLIFRDESSIATVVGTMLWFVLRRVAAEVEITYSVARENAEAIGLTHLPEGARSDGRRAAKPAHLAISSTNAGEHGASRHQLIRILNSLAVQYLPDVKDAARAIEPRSRDSACPYCVRDVDNR